MSIRITIIINLGSMSGQGGLFIAVSEDDFAIYGTDFADTLIGFDGDDVIHGFGGSDKLSGEGGADLLIGGAGDDFLNGGAGNDVMRGGVGADTYRVNSLKDIIDEGASTGAGDRVYSAVSTNLATMFEGHVEDAHLLGTNDLTALGNGRNNRLFGNGGDNALQSKAGDDTLHGYDGNDLLSGGAGADVLRGGDGDDRLAGGTGADVMFGGPGADRYIINTLGFGDVIRDFGAEDVIALTAIDADQEMAGNQSFEFIYGAFFSGTAGELRFASGLLQGDVNGDGRADFTVRVALDGLTGLGPDDIAL